MPEGGHPVAETLSITWSRAKPGDTVVDLVQRFGELAFRATLTPVLDGTKAG